MCEAWLAFLAIVVWHLFFVLMRPGWEGSFTAFCGRMSLEELAHEHPEEYARQYGRHPARDMIGARSNTPEPTSAEMGADAAIGNDARDAWRTSEVR